MQAFRHMAATGQGGFTVVASGISEALVATAGGIAVAIEAVVIYNFLNVHVGKLALQLKLVVEEFLETLHEVLPAAGGAPARRSPPGAGGLRWRSAGRTATSGDDLEMAGGIFADINITPLTDIFLVLLIIFMVTTTAIAEAGREEGGFKVNLPKGGKGETSAVARDVTVAVLADGRAVVGGKVHDDARAAAGVRRGARAEPGDGGAVPGRRGRPARPRRSGDGARTAGRPDPPRDRDARGAVAPQFNLPGTTSGNAAIRAWNDVPSGRCIR